MYPSEWNALCVHTRQEEGCLVVTRCNARLGYMVAEDLFWSPLLWEEVFASPELEVPTRGYFKVYQD